MSTHEVWLRIVSVARGVAYTVYAIFVLIMAVPVAMAAYFIGTAVINIAQAFNPDHTGTLIIVAVIVAGAGLVGREF